MAFYRRTRRKVGQYEIALPVLHFLLRGKQSSVQVDQKQIYNALSKDTLSRQTLCAAVFYSYITHFPNMTYINSESPGLNFQRSLKCRSRREL